MVDRRLLHGSRVFLTGVVCLTTLGLGGCNGEPSPPGSSVTKEAAMAFREPVGEEIPVNGDWLIRHMSGEPSTLNPILSTDAYASEIFSFIGESLLKRNYETLQLEPELATSWVVSDDHLVYEFRLRENVLWHDGAPFSAHDVQFSFKKIMDPSADTAHLRNYYQDIELVEVRDPFTVRFVYKKPYFRALEICGSLPLVPEHIYKEGDFNDHPMNRKPLGTGPYRFHSWRTGKEILLKRNLEYWGEGVHLERICFRLITDRTAALQVLKKEELDLMGLTPLQWKRQTGSANFQEKFRKILSYEPYYNYVGWNSRRAYFQDPRVRLAMTRLINREKILERLVFGLGVIVTGNFYVNSPEYNRSIPPWSYDPAKAIALLTEAGWVDRDGDGILDKDGVSFRFEFLISSGSRFAKQLATILKEDLRRVGIVVDIRKLEWAVFIQQIQDRRFDAVSLGWSLGVEADPYQVWHSSQAEKGSNFVSFKNTEADHIIEKARITFDREQRIELFHRFHQILHEEQPYTFLFCTASLVALDRRFHEVKVYPLGLNSREWFVPLALQRYP